MIAVQGPQALGMRRTARRMPLGAWAITRPRKRTIAGVPGIVSRTGYTGEDGCELIVQAAQQPNKLWSALDRSTARDAAGLGPAIRFGSKRHAAVWA